MSLMLGCVGETPYPHDVLERCRSGDFGMSVMIDDQVPRLLARRASGEHTGIYLRNGCQVEQFGFDAATGKGFVFAVCSLLEDASEISMSGKVLDTKNHRILGSLPIGSSAKDAQICELKTEFEVGQAVVDSDDVAVLIEAKWTCKDGKKNSIAVEYENVTGALQTVYTHDRPKKEDKLVEIKIVANDVRPHPVEFTELEKIQRGNEELIIVAFNRGPENFSDLDYRCNVVNFPGSRYPTFAAPGKGIITVIGASPTLEGISGSCIVTASDGGGFALEDLGAVPGIFRIVGNELHYDMNISWNQQFLKPGGRSDVKYHYTLRICANFITATGSQYRACVTVTTRDESPTTGVLERTIPMLQFLWGCMAHGTPILMADGKTKAIQDIKIGDKVMGVQGNEVSVNNVWKGIESGSMRQIKVEGQTLLLTLDHPVLTYARNWRRAKDVSAGDEVFGIHKSRKTIDTAENVPYENRVYNLDLDGHDHAMIAGSIVVGDNYRQNII